MTKVILLGDTHFGARNSNKTVEYWQRLFYENTFWPYVKENGIKNIVQMGDYFDNRKWINLQTMAFQNEVFVEKSKELDCNVHVLVGNHDIPLRHSLDHSSPSQILSQHSNFTVWDKLGNLDIDDTTFTIIPWICKENEGETVSAVREGGDICLGHFEVQGFIMHPGAISHDGLLLSDFEKWNKVYSGHYHTQSEKGNIQYTGTPYQMNWSDASTRHGFWVFDTTDSSIEFVENPYRYFHRFVWDNGCDAHLDNINNSYVKVNVKRKSDFEVFEKFIDKINFNSPFELKIIETYEEYSQDNVQDIINLSSTEQLIEEYIDEVATNTNKKNVKKMMIDIYEEAMEVEE